MAQEGHDDYCLQSYSYRFSPTLLEGRVAFITGGGSGIGFRIAELFMRHGCDTVIASRNLGKLEDVCVSWGVAHSFRVCLSVRLLNSWQRLPEESAWRTNLMWERLEVCMIQPNLQFATYSSSCSTTRYVMSSRLCWKTSKELISLLTVLAPPNSSLPCVITLLLFSFVSHKIQLLRVTSCALLPPSHQRDSKQVCFARPLHYSLAWRTPCTKLMIFPFQSSTLIP